MVKQGDIIWVSFDPALGHEQKKTRPALVISNDKFHHYCGNMTVVAPISHSHVFPLHVELPRELVVDGMVLIDQIKTIDLGIRDYKVLGHIDTQSAFFRDIKKRVLGIFV